MSASILIYIHDDNDLPWYLDRLAEAGFVETDYCELRAQGRDVRDRVKYGPCEPMSYGEPRETPTAGARAGWRDAANEPRAVEAWTIESVRALGSTTSIDIAAEILGIGRTKAYAMAKDGEFPVRLLNIGRRYLVPVPALIELLTRGD